MKCWYGFISTDVRGGNYDDDITTLTITGLRMVRRENSQHQKMEYNPVPLIFMPLLYLLIKLFTTTSTPGVDSASNTNEYQEYFLGVKVAGA